MQAGYTDPIAAWDDTVGQLNNLCCWYQAIARALPSRSKMGKRQFADKGEVGMALRLAWELR